jgi:hypothetical protein
VPPTHALLVPVKSLASLPVQLSLHKFKSAMNSATLIVIQKSLTLHKFKSAMNSATLIVIQLSLFMDVGYYTPVGRTT